MGTPSESQQCDAENIDTLFAIADRLTTNMTLQMASEVTSFA